MTTSITNGDIDVIINDLLQNAGVLQTFYKRKLSSNSTAIILNNETCPEGTQLCSDVDCLNEDLDLDPTIYTASGATCLPTSSMEMHLYNRNSQTMLLETLMENLITHSSHYLSKLHSAVQTFDRCSDYNRLTDETAMSKLCGMKKKCTYDGANKRCQWNSTDVNRHTLIGEALRRGADELGTDVTNMYLIYESQPLDYNDLVPLLNMSFAEAEITDEMFEDLVITNDPTLALGAGGSFTPSSSATQPIAGGIRFQPSYGPAQTPPGAGQPREPPQVPQRVPPAGQPPPPSGQSPMQQLQQQLNTWEQTAVDAQEKLRDCETNKNSLKDQLNTCIATSTDVEVQLRDLTRQHTDLTRQHRDLTRQHTELERRYEGLENEHNGLQQQQQLNTINGAEIQRQKDNIENELRDLRHQHEALRVELAQVNLARDTLLQQLQQQGQPEPPARNRPPEPPARNRTPNNRPPEPPARNRTPNNRPPEPPARNRTPNNRPRLDEEEEEGREEQKEERIRDPARENLLAALRRARGRPPGREEQKEEPPGERRPRLDEEEEEGREEQKEERIRDPARENLLAALRQAGGRPPGREEQKEEPPGREERGQRPPPNETLLQKQMRETMERRSQQQRFGLDSNTAQTNQDTNDEIQTEDSESEEEAARPDAARPSAGRQPAGRQPPPPPPRVGRPGQPQRQGGILGIISTNNMLNTTREANSNTAQTEQDAAVRDDEWTGGYVRTRSVRGKQNSRHKTNGNRSTKQTNKRKTQIVESPFM
jgi:hypothetical protein